jgi:hypothetical protein
MVSRGLSATAICLLMGFFSAGAYAQNPHIDVTIIQSGGNDKLDFINSACSDRPGEKGCVLMSRGSKNWISWELDRNSTGEGWVLTRLDFSPDGVHWGDPGYPLSGCTVSAFRLTEQDRITGHASTAQVLGNGKRMRIWDENDNDPQTPCITHYRLTAENINTGNITDSDPVIDNRGRN